MGYIVEVDHGSAYELVYSFGAYSGKVQNIELGTAWVKSVRDKLSTAFTEKLAQFKKQKQKGDLVINFCDLLVWQCPRGRSATQFLEWLKEIQPKGLEQYILPWLRPGESLSPNFEAVGSQIIDLLTEWNDQYFTSIRSLILEGLQADGEEKRRRIGDLPPEELIERATNGIRFAPIDGEFRIVLIPQYHCVPANIYSHYKGMYMIGYPCDALPTAEDEPPPSLLRLTRGLADKNRLRILRFLAEGPRSFMEIVRYVDLAKSTTHHHLIALRAAGLVQLQTSILGSNDRYILRTSALDKLELHIRGFLEV